MNQFQGSSVQTVTIHNFTSVFCIAYKILSESSWTVIAVIASVREDERGDQGHTSPSLLHQSAMDGKIERRICVKFYLKLGKSATETLEILPNAFREHSLRWRVVSDWHSGFRAG
jgi:hypothetical protein